MLANIPLFACLGKADLQILEENSCVKTFPKRSILINEGDLTNSLYVLERGKVKVYLGDENGKEIVLNIHGPGEYFGELALLDNAPRPTSVMTLTESSTVIISKQQFDAMLEKHPRIAGLLLKGLTQRMRQLTENVRSLALMDVYGRVAKLLLSLADEHDGELKISERLTQQELANRIGASREMVSRILKDLANGGYISTVGREIRIHDKLRSY